MRTVDPEQHRARREHILHAAAELFAFKGFEGTRTADICRAAGISSGNLFHYFSSKRDIFASLLRHDREATAARLQAALEQQDAWEALLDLIDGLAEAAAEPVVPWLVLEAMMQARRDPELAGLLGADAADEQAAITQLLERLRGAGRVDPGLDPETTGAWIMTLIGATYLAGIDDAPGVVAQQALLRTTVERLLTGGPPDDASAGV